METIFLTLSRQADTKFLKMVTDVPAAGLSVGNAVQWEKNPTKKMIIQEFFVGGMAVLEERETKALFWTKNIRLKRDLEGEFLNQ